MTRCRHDVLSDYPACMQETIDALVKALGRARLFIEGLTKRAEFQCQQPALGGRQELAAIDAVLDAVGSPGKP